MLEITIEGEVKSGKSTAAAFIAKVFRDFDIKVEIDDLDVKQVEVMVKEGWPRLQKHLDAMRYLPEPSIKIKVVQKSRKG